MATTKITDLTAYTDPVSTDVLPIVDVSGDLTKKVSIADLMENAGSGSAAAPGISFDGDPNTGIYRPGADQVAISTNGTGRLFIDASGDIKLGSAAAAGFRLAVDGDAWFGNGSGVELGRLFNDAGVLHLRASSNVTGLALGTNGGEKARIDSSGRLGVGTSSPQQLLHLSNTSQILFPVSSTTNAISFFKDGTPSFAAEVGCGAATGIASALKFDIYNGSSWNTAVNIDSSSRVGIGTTSPETTLHVAGTTDGDALRISQGGQVYKIGRRASDGALMFTGLQTAFTSFRFGTDGDEERFVIDSSGNVGIGTATVSNQLHIVGSNTSNYIRLDNSDGARTYLGIESGRSIIYAQNNAGGDSPLAFAIGATERARIDSSGRLGLGTSSPSEKLHITTGNIQLTDGYTLQWGGSSTFINGYNAGILQLCTGSTPRVYIDSSGNVGIGTTNPSATLETAGRIFANFANPDTNGIQLTASTGTNAAAMQFSNTGGNFYVGLDSSNGGRIGSGAYAGSIWHEGARSIGFGTNNQLRATIDSSGRLLVGTTSSISSFGSAIQIAGSNSASTQLISRYDNNTDGSWLYFAKSRSASVGTNTIVQNGDKLGSLGFYGADGTSYVTSAIIAAEVDGTPGTNDMPGRLVFSTTADGASSPTERVRIASDGAFYVQDVYDSTTATSANVSVNLNGRLRRSTSSAKYKTNIQTLEDSYADALLDCRPVWYQSTCANDNPDYGYWGFIAEEVAEIDPRLVFWKTVDISHDEKGSPVETPCDPEPEGVFYDRFVPHLLNLIKRQQQAIETLEAKVAALEAG